VKNLVLKIKKQPKRGITARRRKPSNPKGRTTRQRGESSNAKRRVVG
jgi:hypothetical protein